MKNYIAEFMKENDLWFDEKFNITGAKKNPYYFNSDYDLINGDEIDGYDSFSACHMILRSSCLLEKIKPKPKTLMTQLREQGYGYCLNAAGHITKLYDVYLAHNNLIKQGSIFITESDAKREGYRRELEFEMQEWARENNDGEINWGDICALRYFLWFDFQDNITETGNSSYKGSGDFNVYFTNLDIAEKACKLFGDKIKQYYEWDIN